ncbi:MAG: site-specific DNA-methyltransferase, partial [Deltaproteobacteria bacterium]
LYLWNKTFLNAHLIKNGLADTDIEYDYKNRKKFLDIQEHLVNGGMV